MFSVKGEAHPAGQRVVDTKPCKLSALMQESETQWLLPAKGEHVRARREPSLVQDVPRVRSRVFMAKSHTVSGSVLTWAELSYAMFCLRQEKSLFNSRKSKNKQTKQNQPTKHCSLSEPLDKTSTGRAELLWHQALSHVTLCRATRALAGHADTRPARDQVSQRPQTRA